MINIYKISILLLLSLFAFSSCNNNAQDEEVSQPIKDVTGNLVALENQDNKEEEDLLRMASLEGDVEKVEELLARNVNVNALDQDGRSAIMFAGFNGHLKIVEALVEKGAKINLQDYVGRTALMFASSGKFPETVKFLLENDAEVNLVDSEENFTAIMFAASEGNTEVVKILLDFKADPNLKDVDGENAELFARTNGHIELADFLKTLAVD